MEQQARASKSRLDMGDGMTEIGQRRNARFELT
jgi:hypothetical protein